MTHFTDEEMATIKEKSGLDFRHAPAVIAQVSKSQMSIARHYGGIVYGSYNYLYHPGTDELIRKDVIKWMADRMREEKKKRAGKMKDAQTRLF